MNKYIKEQLLKCKTFIPEFDDDTTELLIKGNFVREFEGELDASHNYVIQLEPYIINPPDTFTLADNWNKGVIPKSKYLYCNPKKIVGKMVQFDAVGYDIDNKVYLSDRYIDLWLPRKGFKVLSRE